MYLNSKVEQVQIPVLSRDAVLVDDGHGNGREAVGQNREAGAVLELCKACSKGGGMPVMRHRSPGEKGVLLLLQRVVAVGHADRKVIALLVGSHGVLLCLGGGVGWFPGAQ